MTTSIENMDAENSNLQEKCEHMMETIVEYRKVYGKMCKNYVEKSLKVETQLLSSNLSLLKHIEPKHKPPELDYKSINEDVTVFKNEILANQKRKADLEKRVRNTHEVLLLMKNDKITKILSGPFDAKTILAYARNKKGV